MDERILVAYATKHGSTREVAETVAAELEATGLAAELREAASVGEIDGYAGVVVGGAIYTGRWHPDARRFLQRHREELALVPVAIFGVGPKTLDEADVAASRRQLGNALRKVPEIEPVSVAIFGGVIRPEGLRFPFDRIPASDARDWDAIRAWAAELATAFTREPAATR